MIILIFSEDLRGVKRNYPAGVLKQTEGSAFLAIQPALGARHHERDMGMCVWGGGTEWFRENTLHEASVAC